MTAAQTPLDNLIGGRTAHLFGYGIEGKAYRVVSLGKSLGCASIPGGIVANEWLGL